MLKILDYVTFEMEITLIKFCLALHWHLESNIYYLIKYANNLYNSL